MTLPAFLAVWLATWAACWFGLARVWPGRKDPTGIDERGFLWWRLRGGAREWAPLIATLTAFGVEGVLWIVRS